MFLLNFSYYFPIILPTFPYFGIFTSIFSKIWWFSRKFTKNVFGKKCRGPWQKIDFFVKYSPVILGLWQFYWCLLHAYFLHVSEQWYQESRIKPVIRGTKLSSKVWSWMTQPEPTFPYICLLPAELLAVGHQRYAACIAVSIDGSAKYVEDNIQIQ